MRSDGKQIFRIGSRVYELVEVDGPIFAENDVVAAQFDHDAGVLRISRLVPVGQRAWLVAAAVSDACFQFWNPVPVDFPNWQPDDRSGSGPTRPGFERDRPPA
jgi:hypothetical protein